MKIKPLLIKLVSKKHKRLFRIMRLAILFLFVSILQMTANVKAQEASINLKSTKIMIGELLNEIEKQTNYLIVYDHADVNKNKEVKLSSKSGKVVDFLNEALKGSGISHIFENDYIVLKATAKVDQSIPTIKAKGTISDKGGEPLIGVSIAIKGTNKATLSDTDGKFTLEASVGQILVISYIGYKTREIKVENESPIIIQLEESSVALETVVVTALGIKRSEKALSYNAQQISSDDINTVKDANFVNSLNGKVAGVNINSSSTGIGGATKVVIRGAKSIGGDNNVLYVVDGVPLKNFSGGEIKENEGIYSLQPASSEGISDLNSDDIESMTVLTGPAAAALYGSSAANGAIVITTKKGKSGKAKIVVSNQTTFMKPFVTPKFQNSYRNEPGSYQSWGDKESSSYDPMDFFNTGSNVQNSVSLSVGSDKNQTYASAAASNANGIIPNNEYDRYNFTLRNTTSFLNDKMTLDFGASYIIQKNKNMTAQGVYFNPIVAVYTFPRGEDFNTVQLFEDYNDGRMINTQRWVWGDQGLNLQNPYWTANRNIFTHDRKRYMINANLKYDILKWLNIAGRVRIDNANATEEKKLYASTITLLAGENGSYGRSNIDENQTYADVLVNINKYFGSDFSLSANIGASLLNTEYVLSGFTGNLGREANLFALRGIDKNDAKSRFLEDQWEKQTQAVFANVEIGWRSMLYLTLTGRNDWDSALAGMPDKSFFYPSVGLSSVISEMVSLPKFISYMKLRGSFASVGNSIPVGLSKPTYSFNEGEGKWSTNTFYPVGQLYPERTHSWEVGLNTKFLGDKLDLNVTLYKSNTYKQTVKIPMSAASGYSYRYVQTGNIENKGIEASLAYTQKWKDFSVHSSFTASANRNKIIDLGRYDEDGIIKEIEQDIRVDIGSSMRRLTQGGTLGDLWTTSVVKKDENGDIYVDPQSGRIMSEEKIQKVGSVLPDWNFGFSNTFGWKDLSFGFVVSARLGGKVISYTQAILDAYGVSEASAVARDNGGIPVNNGFVNAESWYKVVGGTGGIFSHYVYDATNVRLQEANIGYTLPSKWLDNKVRITASVVGRNLLMIYNKAPFDPEAIASTSNYYQGLDYFMTPSLRSIGFNLKFEF